MISFLQYFVTVAWFFGFVEFYTQILLFGKASMFSGWSLYATVLVVGTAGFLCRKSLASELKEIYLEFKGAPPGLYLLLALTAGIWFLGAFQAHFPPHLLQESDAIHFHMALPRQHLLIGSLAHLKWSAGDLWSMPVAYGFAPFWFMAKTFNKWPQFLSALGAFFLLFDLGRKKAQAGTRGWLPAIAVFTTHGVAIQLGTAMFDLVLLYFLLGGIHAYKKNKPIWAGIHLGIFGSAKALSIIQVIAVLVVMAGLHLALRHYVNHPFKWKKASRVLAVSAVVIVALMTRSSLVSMNRAGTPVFPLGICTFSTAVGCQGIDGQIIRDSAKLQLETGGHYGLGLGPSALITHLWRIAVPTTGVNNEFDYPLGLAWLLFVVFLGFAVFSKPIPTELVLAVSFWITWWFASQQSRWLYPTLALGWLGTVAIQKKASQNLLIALLIISSSLSLLSLARAYRGDFGVSANEIHRQEEAKIQINETTHEVSDKSMMLYLNRTDLTPKAGNRIWVLK